MSDPSKPKDSSGAASDAGAVLGIVFEFFGFVGAVPGIGWLLDYYWLNPGGGPRWGFGVGLALGFGYGVYHLYRRARVLVQNPKGGYGTAPGSDRSREGYTKDLDRRLQSVERDMDRVGRDIDGLPSRGVPSQKRPEGKSRGDGGAT